MTNAYVLRSIICLLIPGVLASINKLYSDRPTIVTTDSTEIDYDRNFPRYIETVELHTNFSVKCESETPITWKTFKGFTGSYQVDYAEFPGEKYESTIHLINITHYYVGFFFCVYNKTQWDYDYSLRFLSEERYDLIEISGVSMVYVFVNDSDNALVPMDVSEMIILDDYLVITCRSTMRNISVEILEDGTKLHGTLYDPRFGQLHDPTIGFLKKFSNAGEIYGRTFTCLADVPASNGNEINFTVTYHVPQIQSASGVYGIQGEQLILNCSIDVLKGELFAMTWTLPNDTILRPQPTLIDHPDRTELRIGVSTITIEDIHVDNDAGYYQCEVIDRLMKSSSHQIYIEILNKSDDSIEISLDGIDLYETSSLRSVIEWQVKYRGYPKPTLEWYDNSDAIITTSTNGKYDVKISDNYITLKIYYLRSHDFGYYTLRANNSLNAIEKKIELREKVKPEVYISRNMFVHKGKLAKFKCECVDGYPLPTITWTFRRCKPTPKWPNCEAVRRVIGNEHIQITSDSILNQTSVLSLTATDAGMVECSAVNTQGRDADDALLLVVAEDEDIPPRIYGLASDTKIIVGDNVTLICEASAYKYSLLRWYLNDILIEDSEDTKVESGYTDDTFTERITWIDIKTTNSGRYECCGWPIATKPGSDESCEEVEFNIKVYEPQKPQIDATSSVGDCKRVLLGDEVSLFCNITGIPDPEMRWHKNNQSITDNDPRISFIAGMRTLKIEKSTMEDSGEYECVGENRFGIVKQSIKLIITRMTPLTDIPTKNIAWMAGIALLALIFCTVYLFVRLQRERRHSRELRDAGLANFVKGNPNAIDPDLALHEQADLLPYKKQYEFPMKDLSLGKQLGAGAFGVVVEGLATGILPCERQTKVAVKMVKPNVGNEQLKALVMELKILCHLGQHLNVVNLLGAVTTNIAKRELLVIVELCRFGSVQQFLMKHRKMFVDQRNSETDSIDPKILTKGWRHSYDSGYENNSSGKTVPSGGIESTNSETLLMQPTSSSSATIAENINLGNDTVPLQPSDNRSPLTFITTTDLVCWLFQVARGMEYLASRKVMHGDLAARNILLCDGNVVKICDFGLARSMCKSYNYVKKGEAPLPLKWLALEAIGDRVFSTFSDVWSFGVVMWELFSLGRTPYPGMDANHDLYLKLKDGYRMEKPTTATQEIYDIMLHCWNVNPESRPTFNALEGRLSKLLENGMVEHYVDLNEQYVQMYANNLKQNPTDYTSFLGPPEGPAPSLPSSAHNRGRPKLAAYLSMKPMFRSNEISTQEIENAVNNPGYALSYGASGDIDETKM